MDKKKVLVVDDEYTIRELVEISLEDDYEVWKAENAKQAFELVGMKPDLMILDIMMPDVDGYEVCKQIKSDDLTRHIPIIMLTAKHAPDDLNEAIRCNVDEFMTKPFEPDFLKRRVDFYLLDDSGKKTEGKLLQSGKSIHYVKERD